MQRGKIRPRRQKSGIWTATVEVWDDQKDTCQERTFMPITGSSEGDLIHRVNEYMDMINNVKIKPYAPEPKQPTEERPAPNSNPISVQTNLFGL